MTKNGQLNPRTERRDSLERSDCVLEEGRSSLHELANSCLLQTTHE